MKLETYIERLSKFLKNHCLGNININYCSVHEITPVRCILLCIKSLLTGVIHSHNNKVKRKVYIWVSNARLTMNIILPIHLYLHKLTYNNKCYYYNN